MQRLVIGPDGPRGTHSFTRGFVPSLPPKRKAEDEVGALARALYLERIGRTVEALEFLEEYLSSKK
jgi:hypothetical protein